MDFDKIKEIITSFIKKIYILFKTNKKIAGLIFIILLIIIFTYIYSEKRRLFNKIEYITNNLVYDSPRLTIEYCGVNSNIKDKILVSIISISNKNGIEIVDENIDLWKYNLSSEFVVEIKGKTNPKYDNLVNQPYKIKTIDPINPKKLYFSNDTVFPAIYTTDVNSNSNSNGNGNGNGNDNGNGNGNGSVLVELIFYRINPRKNDNPYKYKKLCEYNISSSYNCFLIGSQILDYCSIDMIQKVLILGARYIEIPIYDLEKRDETTPILYSGFRNYRLSLNYIKVEKALELIGATAFNSRALDNYNDPLFIFLNIKTTNVKTLDKVNDYIIKYLNKYLLPKTYNHINIAYTKMCDLEGKCVILSSNGYQKSKLDTIINCSTETSYLKRITYNEALLNKDEMMGPKFKLNSNKVRFVSSNIKDSHDHKAKFRDHLEIVDNNINFFNYGITKGDGLNISGSKNAKNNSGEYMYTIHSITRNKIIFEKDVELTNEEVGTYITLEIYDSHIDSEKLEEYNKNNLTIVVPDSKFTSTNYNYTNIMYKGCQFVCMNFQNVDKYMKQYFNLFKEKALMFKPRVLINSINIPKSVSINSLVPKENKNLALNYDYTIIDNVRENRYANISPYNNNKLRLIGYGETLNDKNLRNVKFSMNYNNTNSKFIITKPLNNQQGYISIKFKTNDIDDIDDTKIERYLTYNECCCYLYLTKKPDNVENHVKYKFNNSASFLSLMPPITKKGFTSLGVIKNMKEKDKLYYLKIRSSFNSDRKLFVKNVKEYETKLYFNQYNSDETITKMVVLKPKFNQNGNFFPTGDIIISEDRLDTIETSNSDTPDTPDPTTTPVRLTYDRTDPNAPNPTITCKQGHSLVDMTCYKPCSELNDPTDDSKIYKEDPNNKTKCFNEYNAKDTIDKEKSDPGEFKIECPYGYELQDDGKCYKVCDEGYIGDKITINGTETWNKCIERPLETKAALQVNSTIIKTDQSFETELFSGAVDHPRDYELIWDNSDFNEDDLEKYDNQKISIWKPIPNEGFMDMGNVFVNGYRKPLRKEVVCISIDYLKEERIYSEDENYEYGTPIFHDNDNQLAIWNISKHDYVKSYPFVKENDFDPNQVAIPNMIEFKMYDFITEEKDYFDRLYLDTNISSDKEKEATLFNISFDTIVESGGNDVYDYLMKLENSNGKLISYTPSDSGSKMCMALPQPYWSSFYDDVSNDYKDQSPKPKITCKDDHTNINDVCYKPCSELNSINNNIILNDEPTSEWTDHENPKQCKAKHRYKKSTSNCKNNYTLETLCVDSDGNKTPQTNGECLENNKEETYCVNENYTMNRLPAEKHEYNIKCPSGYELDKVKRTCNSIEKTNNTTKYKPKIKFESCKSRDYFGTNWNIYDDNTIRLEGNKDVCLTYNGDPNTNISVDINNQDNYLYLDKCSDDANQNFEMNDDNIKVLTNTEYDPNACITHSPNDGLRLEECGDKKYTVVSKWQNKVATIDKCNRIDAEEEMEKIGAIELCKDLSYYIIYLSDGTEHRHEEYCSYKDAREVYESEKSKHKRGLAIVHRGKILLKKRHNPNADIIFKNYAIKLLNVEGDCVKCKKPSKVLCVENSVVNSEFTHFENDKQKKEISNVCRKLKNEDNFRCSRGYRQQFINNINPSDYCIGYNKEVFIYIYSKDPDKLNLDMKRLQDGQTPVSARMRPVDNLLGETYDTNYHMFLKGLCTKAPDSNKFRIIFDNNTITKLTKNYIDMYKFSNDIILNYVPKYDRIKVGTKVLAKLGYQENTKLLEKRNITFDTNFKIGNLKIPNSHVRWMGVVIDKLKNNQVEVMFSINSYESNPKYKTIASDIGRPFSLSNIRKIYNVNDLVLLKKAPLCL